MLYICIIINSEKHKTMKTQHTKGEWTPEKETWIVTDNNSVEMRGNYANVLNCRFKPFTPKDRINREAERAKLIAAAPVMLDLLQRFMSAPVHEEARQNTEWLFLEEIKQAIKKATE